MLFYTCVIQDSKRTIISITYAQTLVSSQLTKGNKVGINNANHKELYDPCIAGYLGKKVRANNDQNALIALMFQKCILYCRKFLRGVFWCQVWEAFEYLLFASSFCIIYIYIERNRALWCNIYVYV